MESNIDILDYRVQQAPPVACPESLVDATNPKYTTSLLCGAAEPDEDKLKGGDADVDALQTDYGAFAMQRDV
ncbi:hypothetical protein HOO65_060300 [Ceratocystis lukuohia]|uniref:Uncharacterized protein n=1 Tax=Ceratocystis lukuohia TaxID=2019550 RepID=A0ABR4MDX1_9PEZI